MARRVQRFTVYDMMEQKGVFAANPANSDSADPVSGESLYKGPVAFPRMVYDPKGCERVTNKGEIREIGGERIRVGERRELISKLVKTPEELAQALAAGWHEHPADAIAASGRAAPESEVARLTRELAVAKAQRVTDETVASGEGAD